jgi:hypothetical protein
MVHRRVAGWAPPAAAVDTISTALVPGLAMAELTVSATCCPKIGAMAKTRKLLDVSTLAKQPFVILKSPEKNAVK